jgi:DNA-binding beta-propeller fold protein YncE
MKDLRVVGTTRGRGTGGPALDCPAGAALSPDGAWLFVADAGLHCVVVYAARTLAYQRTFGSEGSGRGQLSFPEGCCVSPENDLLYVADCFNNRIASFTQEGKPIDTFGSYGLRAGEFDTPCDVAAVRGCLIVSETRRVQVLGLDGSPRQVVQMPGKATLLGLCNVQIRSRRVFVNDAFAREVHVLHSRAPGGEVTWPTVTTKAQACLAAPENWYHPSLISCESGGW